MIYFLYFLLVVAAMEILALVIKGLIIGQSSNPWTGGNGCNLVGGTGRLACCTPHDKAYKEGGWVIARFNADIALFKCIWKQNSILAVLMFIGVRAFGMWAFQFGTKRNI